jgi:hypothetical protein
VCHLDILILVLERDYHDQFYRDTCYAGNFELLPQVVHAVTAPSTRPGGAQLRAALLAHGVDMFDASRRYPV